MLPQPEAPPGMSCGGLVGLFLLNGPSPVGDVPGGVPGGEQVGLAAEPAALEGIEVPEQLPSLAGQLLELGAGGDVIVAQV